MNEINKLVGERIAAIRKYNRINQADLAEKLGKSLRTVQKYESGEIDIPLSTLAEVAEILNTTQSTISAYESGKTVLLTAFAIQISKKYNVSLDWLCSREK